MTIRELIIELQKLDQDAVVLVHDETGIFDINFSQPMITSETVTIGYDRETGEITRQEPKALVF